MAIDDRQGRKSVGGTGPGLYTSLSDDPVDTLLEYFHDFAQNPHS